VTCAVPTCALLIALVAAVAACNGDDTPAANDGPPPVVFDTAVMRLASHADTMRLTVELARSEPQKTMGLMERRTLSDSAGMLFVYGATQPESAAFWMFRTRIPLDIAYVDSSGVIRSIVSMEPCQSTLAQGCQTYPAGVPYRAALEVNKGFFSRHRLAVGDRLLLGDTLRTHDATGTRSTSPQ
jgi:uncharacterized protein